MKFVPRKLEKTADVSRARTTPGHLIKNILGVVAIITLAYLGLGLASDAITSNISEETETRWFSWTDSMLESRITSGRALEIFKRLTADKSLRPLPYKLYGLDIDMPNAAALPGGAVGITSSLLAEVESERGLAMVIAHELGHHQHRHCLKRLGRSLLTRGILAVLLGDTEVGSLTLFLQLAEAGYSRRQEQEADEFGMRLVHSVYGSTADCLEFYQLIESKYREGQSRWGQFHQSHPLTTDRIESLRKLQEELASSGSDK